MADIHVVNKADRPDANRTAAELARMLTLAPKESAMGWKIPILRTAALDGEGVPQLADMLVKHREWLGSSGELERRERATAAVRIRALAKELLLERMADPTSEGRFEELVDAVAARRLDPTSAARILVDAATGPFETTLERIA